MTIGLIDRLRERCSLPSTVSARDDDDPPVAVYLNPDGPEAAQALEKMREALTQCRGLFTEIRNDWSDPRAECREGWAVIDEALSLLEEK
jgi:hypothetical protein